MSHDFVRQLPGSGLLAQRKAGMGDVIHVDVPMLLLLLIISAYGLLILYSAVGQQIEPVISQGTKILVGLSAMLVIAQIPPIVYLRLAPWIFLIGLIALVLVYFFGVEVKGARRWLRIPGITNFQPSEIMKIVVPLVIAWYLGSRPLPPRFKHLFWSALMILIPAVLIIIQNDTGTAIMVMMSGLFVVLLAGVRWRIVITGFLALLLASPAWYLFLAPEHIKIRILTVFNPYLDPTGAGYNIIQSQIAIGSGGVYGKGYGNGAQSHLDFIPESNTDFILAVLAEEFGLLGILFLICLYLFILLRSSYIAYSAKDMFSRLLAGSITLTFFMYVFVNMAMVSGLLPVIGLPLPLISRGGTAIVTFFVCFGLLMSIQTHGRLKKS